MVTTSAIFAPLPGLRLLQHLLQRPGDEALDAEGAVVGGVDDVELIAELRLQRPTRSSSPVQNIRLACGSRRSA